MSTGGSALVPAAPIATPWAAFRPSIGFVNTSGFPYEKVARIGYAAKGVVYLLLGYLSCFAAWSGRRPPSGTKGAMSHLMVVPFGSAVLLLIGAGVACYVLWRLLQAVVDPENKGTSLRGVSQRIFYLGIAVVYSSVSWAAIRLVIEHRGGDDEGPAPLVAMLLEQPFGRFAVMILALGMGAFAIHQIAHGVTGAFRKKLDHTRIPTAIEPVVTWVGRIGLISRGLAFSIMATFMWEAAIRFDSHQAKALGGALQILRNQPHGKLLLGIMGLGLAVYGFYAFVLAAYRSFNRT